MLPAKLKIFDLIRQLQNHNLPEQKETKAATRIQANFRGHKTRKELAGQGGREDEDDVYPNDENDDCPGKLRLG